LRTNTPARSACRREAAAGLKRKSDRGAQRAKNDSFALRDSLRRSSSVFILETMNEVTAILSAIEHGAPQASGQLLPLVYDELRRLAAQKLSHEKPGQTLDATALVHEAYLR